LRQGNPQWLWPEVAERDWRWALLEIERACAAVLGGKHPSSLTAEPAAMALAGYTSGMGPMLGHWLGQGLIHLPTAPAEACEHQLCANTVRMERLLGHAKELTARLAAGGVRATVLKGAYTASSYFPQAGCRPMSDIDILISPDDANTAQRVLQALAYRQTARTSLETTWVHANAAVEPRTMRSLEADDPWAIDLHLSLDIPGPPGSAPARLSQARHATKPCEALPDAEQLAQPMLLLHLAAHAGSGFHNLTLLRLLEVVLVARVDAANGSLSWEDFADLGAATGSLAFAFPALALARQLSPDDIPREIVERCAQAAPPRIRRLVDRLRPATAHRIDRPTLREHFAWTSGPGGWLRRLAADILPEPRSLRRTAAIHASRARGLLNREVT
jgi:hypothetical protein